MLILIFYGEEPLEKLEAIFPERDVHEMALIKAAIDLKKPILAICRGMQILNVTYGGTLYQDISYAPGKHIKTLSGRFILSSNSLNKY